MQIYASAAASTSPVQVFLAQRSDGAGQLWQGKNTLVGLPEHADACLCSRQHLACAGVPGQRSDGAGQRCGGERRHGARGVNEVHSIQAARRRADHHAVAQRARRHRRHLAAHTPSGWQHHLQWLLVISSNGLEHAAERKAGQLSTGGLARTV